MRAAGLFLCTLALVACDSAPEIGADPMDQPAAGGKGDDAEGVASVCPPPIAEYNYDCILDKMGGTQQVGLAISDCSENGQMWDARTWTCALDSTASWCDLDVDDFILDIAPACVAELEALEVQSDVQLRYRQLPASGNAVLESAKDTPEVTFANGEMFTYDRTDTTFTEAMTALRSDLKWGFDFTDNGTITDEDATEIVSVFDEVADAARSIAQSDEYTLGHLSRDHYGTRTEADVNRLVFVFAETKTIVNFEFANIP